MQFSARKSLPSTLLLLLALFGVASASAKDNVSQVLAGKWRGEFAAAEQKIPFNFEIKAGNPDSARLTLINGARRDEFKLVSRGEGAYAVPLGNYDSELQLQVQPDGSLSGRYHYLAAERQANDLPFTATHGKDWRFVPASGDKAAIDLNGSWRFSTVTARGAREQIGVFKQHGNHLTGVLQSPTGDSRALEGNIVGDEFFLSGFTGPAPSYYRGKLGEAPQTLAGTVVARGTAQPFTAALDNTAELPDPFTLTTAATTGPVTLAFPDASGKTVTLDDPRYRGKVVVLQMLGTWCPNCADETKFLAPWYRKNKQRGVEVIGVAFEQEDSLEHAQVTLPRYQKFYDIDYPVLFGGGVDKEKAGEKLPWLSKVIAYPTAILLDREGRVREIHTGFNSPETGADYEEFVKHFNRSVDALLAEPAPRG